MGFRGGIFRIYGVVIFRLIGVLCWVISDRLIGFIICFLGVCEF